MWFAKKLNHFVSIDYRYVKAIVSYMLVKIISYLRYVETISFESQTHKDYFHLLSDVLQIHSKQTWYIS